jgi:mono/diheme cytochrome c family protein
MLRAGIFAYAFACVLSLVASSASAETAIARGDYLVNTIMACGNCHSPRDAEGRFIAGKALSGGLTFDTPAFLATAPNIIEGSDRLPPHRAVARLDRLFVATVQATRHAIH